MFSQVLRSGDIELWIAETLGDSFTQCDDHARRQSVAIVRKYLCRTLSGDWGWECTSMRAADASEKWSSDIPEMEISPYVPIRYGAMIRLANRALGALLDGF